MLEAYRQQTEAPRFLSGFFQSPARNFHDSEDVEVDIIREDEDVAVTVADITAGPRLNEATKLTNKRFTPPVYKEAGPISAYRLPLRQAGMTPYEDPNYQAAAMAASLDITRRAEQKVRRAVELMASQVLQTGQLALINEAGASTFTMNFHPKTAHFPTAGVSWATSASCIPLDNLESLCDIIMTNGRSEPENAIFGRTALMNFMKSTQVQTMADNTRFNLVQIDPPTMRGTGGKYHGTLSFGQYRLNIWSYGGRYKHPQTGAITKYVADDKVIVLSPGRLDLTWGNIPTVGSVDSRVLPFLPGRVSSSANGIDLHQTAWLENDLTGLTVQVAARPLTIPTAIDTFGCLDTIP
jgi:uncharacterized membrane protein